MADASRIATTPDPISRIPTPEPPLMAPTLSVSSFGRIRRIPKAFQDCVPSLRANDAWLKPIAHLLAPCTPAARPRTPTPALLPEPTPEPENVEEVHDVIADGFGVFRRYTAIPSRDLDTQVSPDSRIDAPHIASNAPLNIQYYNPLLAFGRAVSKNTKWFHPFLNATVFRLVHWVYTGSSLKLHGEINRLVREVIRAPDFRAEHLEGFDLQREEKRMDEASLREDGLHSCGFKKSSVDVYMPCEKVKYKSFDDIQ